MPEVFHVTLVEILKSFKETLMQAYLDDPQWNKLVSLLQRVELDDNATASSRNPLNPPRNPLNPGRTDSANTENAGASETDPEDLDDRAKRLGLRFKLRHELVYYTNFNDGRERLCIPNSLEKDIFELAHDQQHHEGYHRTYNRIIQSLNMRH